MNFFLKGQMVNTLSHVGHMVFVTASDFCFAVGKQL